MQCFSKPLLDAAKLNGGWLQTRIFSNDTSVAVQSSDRYKLDPGDKVRSHHPLQSPPLPPSPIPALTPLTDPRPYPPHRSPPFQYTHLSWSIVQEPRGAERSVHGCQLRQQQA